MINKPKKRKLPVIIIIILIICLFLFNYFHLFKGIHSYFYNIGVNIKKKIIVEYQGIDNEIYKGINEELLKENVELKKLLNLKVANYEMLTATVIKRDNSWYDTLTIDKGSKDKITTNMAIVNSYGLIGRIKEVGTNYSIVELITNKSFSKIAVDVNNYHGILDHDKNTIIIRNINKDSDININDKVYTNGLGGLFPSGIYIGKVIDIYYDDLDLSKVLKVSLASNFENIRYVNIIRR